MKGKLLLFAAALAVASALVAVPLTAASSVDNKLAIGQSLHFLGGPGASAGTFIASGAIHDSGTVTSHAIITPLGNQADGQLEGSETFVGALGTFTTEFSGIAGPVGAPHEAVQGTSASFLAPAHTLTCTRKAPSSSSLTSRRSRRSARTKVRRAEM